MPAGSDKATKYSNVSGPLEASLLLLKQEFRQSIQRTIANQTAVEAMVALTTPHIAKFLLPES